MIDILKEDLYVKRVIGVIKAKNSNYSKQIEVNGRHSDAFVYILSGSCKYGFSDGSGFTAKEGDVLYLSRGACYTMLIGEDDYRFIFCDFEFDSEKERRCALITPKNASVTENLFNKLHNLYSQPSPTAFTDSLATLYSIYGHLKATVEAEYAGGGIMSRIRAAKEKIEASIDSPSLSLAKIAEEIGISEVYFRRLFRAEYGVSPSQLVTAERIERAKELMRYPFLSLEDCAAKSGFSSLQYFCRVFKRQMGISPAKYRAKI